MDVDLMGMDDLEVYEIQLTADRIQYNRSRMCWRSIRGFKGLLYDESDSE